MSENANSRIAGPSEGWISRFGSAPTETPASAWSEEQKELDNHQVEMLAKGLLRIHPTRPGQGTIPEHVYAISRTTVSIEETELLAGCAPGHELVGGFVTYQEALLEFPQPESNNPVDSSISASPVRHFTEGETVTAFDYQA